MEANRGKIEKVFGQNIKYVCAHKAFTRSLTDAMKRGILNIAKGTTDPRIEFILPK